jgi:hypothetical protein
MLDMLQRGVRGGVSVVSTRYAVANNPLLSGYDDSKPSSYIINLDANNLYGGAMCDALPEGDYSLELVADADAHANADAVLALTLMLALALMLMLARTLKQMLTQTRPRARTWTLGETRVTAQIRMMTPTLCTRVGGASVILILRTQSCV